MNTKLLLVSSIILAISSFVTTNVWADSHTKDECITQLAYAEMSDEEKDAAEEDDDMLCVGVKGEDESDDDEIEEDKDTGEEASPKKDEVQAEEGDAA